MTIPVSLTASMLALLLTTASPSSPEIPDGAASVKTAESSAAADMAALAAGNTEFALAYYDRVRSRPGNIVFSPLSVSIAFSMAEAGAAGRTAEQIRDAMHLRLPESRLHAAFADLVKRFSATAASGKEGSPALSIANSLWGVEGYPYQQPFLDTLKADYGAAFAPVSFADPAKAAAQINAWVSDATAGKISDLIGPGSLAQDTRLVLVNAVHFKGRWAEVFAAGSTKDEEFHAAADVSRKVPMMHQRKRMGYFENDQLQAVSLSYSGSSLSMLVVLPRKADGLPDVEKSLDGKTLSEILGKTSWQEVVLAMPRFKLDSKSDLNDALQAMGMSDAFDPDKADFSRMASHEPLFISNAVHQAMISVDEEGAEAAAATAAMMAPGAARPAPEEHPREFRADHPFLFMVRDGATGSILFMGRVSAP